MEFVFDRLIKLYKIIYIYQLHQNVDAYLNVQASDSNTVQITHIESERFTLLVSNPVSDLLY